MEEDNGWRDWDRGCGALPFKGVKRRIGDGRKYPPVFFIVAFLGRSEAKKFDKKPHVHFCQWLEIRRKGKTGSDNEG